MPFIASVPDERKVVFGEKYSVGFRLSLSFYEEVRALKKWQCLKINVGSCLWQYDW